MSASDEELERFCATAYPRLVPALAYYCGDALLAEELAQEALVVACRRWAQVSRLRSPIGWVYRVGVNQANSWFRRQRAERRARDRVARESAAAHREPDTADRLAVRAALQQLNTRQREVVILRFFLGLSAEEAARVTDSSPGAVRALTHRAISALRRTLDTAEPLEVTDVP